MNETIALNFIYDNLLGEKSIFIKLRAGEGIDLELYSELVRNITILIDVFKKKDYIPKKLALCFVDITNTFYASKDLYLDDESNTLEEMILNLHYLGETLFSTSPLQ